MFKKMICLTMLMSVATSACVEQENPNPQQPAQWTVCETTPEVNRSSWSLSYGNQKLRGDGIQVTEHSAESTDGAQRYSMNIALSTRRDLDTTGAVALNATTQQSTDYSIGHFVINDTNGALVELDVEELDVQWIDATTVHVVANASRAKRINALGEIEEYEGSTFVMTASLVDKPQDVRCQ